MNSTLGNFLILEHCVKGETITLECLASGFPLPTFAWYKDGGRLSTAHSRYKILHNGTLVITNAQLGDSGHYRYVVCMYVCVNTLFGNKRFMLDAMT